MEVGSRRVDEIVSLLKAATNFVQDSGGARTTRKVSIGSCRAFLADTKNSVAIVTDSNVARLLGSDIRKTLSTAFPNVSLIEVPAGEKSKTIRTVSLICDKLAKSGADRKTSLIALGGGVVGDLAGFVASIYKRGIVFFQIPTTPPRPGRQQHWGKDRSRYYVG